ncbi:glycine-rich protein [Nannocystis pusilla]|uniref:receptor protein-tyrosine kinase n=1 Tax=Nannocystis pusilla TaxID=889268 RepID=A0ABS7TKY6_9BACT|nr:glycine-rich protein [Nannocystis pusilla]MBZ5708889.1 hypothetical protein [Nannocystis pusilla]
MQMVRKGRWCTVSVVFTITVGGCDEVSDTQPPRPVPGALAVAEADGDADPDKALVRACEAAALDLCGAECVDITLDARHCGGCGRVCAGTCAAGYCAAPCWRGQIRCDGQCVERTRVTPGGRAREFAFTGAPQTFVVPDCVSRITIEAWGAQGGGSRCCDGPEQDDGGRGAYVRTELEVEPGEALRIVVGGRGGLEGAAGYNGGGVGGEFAGGGGGASDVRRGGTGLADRLVVAGGGGGGQCGCPDHGEGGPGGVFIGGAGVALLPEWQAAGGGTQSDGGAVGSVPGEPGLFGSGGGVGLYHVAGGGGGWFGGGSAYAAGGGGGSSYLGDEPEGSGLPGVRAGDGLVVIRW